MSIRDKGKTVMRTELTLIVVLVVVAGTLPVGVAAATTADAPASLAADSASAQVDGTATATPQANETASDADETNETTSDADETNETASDENESSSLGPGAQLAGVVAVQGTEVESEVDSRAFGQRVAAAATNDSKATVIATDVNDSRERIERLHERLAELERAHEAGNISEGRYRASAAQLTAEINAVDRRLEQANESASTLPERVREANGINTSNIERLRTEARNLSGPEVAEIARGIAGDNAGRGMGPAARGQSGGPPGPGEDRPGRSGDRPGVADGNETNEAERGAAGNGNSAASDNRDRGGRPTDMAAPNNDNDNGDDRGSNATRDRPASGGSSDEAGERGPDARDRGNNGSRGAPSDAANRRIGVFTSTADDVFRFATSFLG